MKNEERKAFELAVENHERAIVRLAELERELSALKSQPGGVVLDKVVSTAPQKIFLIIGEGCPRDGNFSDLHEVTWCEDDIDDGIEYVRSDIARLNQQPAPTGDDAERAAFEAHYHRHDLAKDPISSAYFDSEVRCLWDAWQARAALAQSAEAVELALLREYRLSGIAFNDAQGEDYTVEQSNRAEARMEAAEKACWEFYRTGQALSAKP